MSSQNNNEIVVNIDSLPRSLRNIGRLTHLDEARKLARLMWLLSLYIADDKSDPDEMACEGMAILCELIEDKIAIASGELFFPVGKVYGGAPTLKELLEAGQAALKAREGR